MPLAVLFDRLRQRVHLPRQAAGPLFFYPDNMIGGADMLTKMKRDPVLRLTMAAVMAALVFVATAFLKLPVPMANGYVHLGDGFVLVGAALLGITGAPAAAVGSMLADLCLGFGEYAPVTFVVKGLVALCAAWAMRAKRAWVRVLLVILCEGIMVAGYFAYEWAALGLAAATASVPGNLIQAASGVLLYAILTPALRKVIR